MGKAGLLLIDSHELMLDSLRVLLTPEFVVMGTATTAAEGVAAYERLRPDITLIGIDLRDINGIETGRRILKHFSEARIIFVTMYSHRDYVRQAF